MLPLPNMRKLCQSVAKYHFAKFLIFWCPLFLCCGIWSFPLGFLMGEGIGILLNYSDSWFQLLFNSWLGKHCCQLPSRENYYRHFCQFPSTQNFVLFMVFSFCRCTFLTQKCTEFFLLKYSNLLLVPHQCSLRMFCDFNGLFFFT